MKEIHNRNSAFEVMRILSMLMVCAFHWQLHGYDNKIPYSALCVNQVISFVLGSWGILGVDLFFLLSFFFLIKKNDINYKRVIGLVIKVSFYGTAVVLLAAITGIFSPSILDIFKAVLGVFAYQYWFITVYVVVTVISPLLNKLLKIISYTEAIILMGMQIYITYVVTWAIGNELAGRLSCGITIYTIIYVLENKININPFEKYRILALPLAVLGVVVEVILSYLGTNYNPVFYKMIEKVQTTSSPYILFLSIFVFYCFKNWSFSNKKWINWLGKYSSGAYLLHGGAGFIRYYLWDGLFMAGVYYVMDPIKYTLHYATCILLLFFVGTICEFIYVHTVGNIFNSILDFVFTKLKTVRGVDSK